jgi:hypothetical protein
VAPGFQGGRDLGFAARHQASQLRFAHGPIAILLQREARAHGFLERRPEAVDLEFQRRSTARGSQRRRRRKQGHADHCDA